jgi:ribonuclease HI
MSDKILIYTDGSAIGNPGKGGFGVVMKYKGKVKEFSKGFRLTTNNRMELLAVIFALEQLKTNDIPVKIHSDSKYVLDSITKGWAINWQKKGFKGKKNPDLWQRYLNLHSKFNLEFEWVKGHSGHPENERCDQLAVSASAIDKNLHVDEEYENSKDENALFDF